MNVAGTPQALSELEPGSRIDIHEGGRVIARGEEVVRVDLDARRVVVRACLDYERTLAFGMDTGEEMPLTE